MTEDRQNIENWWRTSIIRMQPGEIVFRGHQIQDLIGHVGFIDMIWLMLRGDLPRPAQSRLLEAALVASVDHGPQAPSIAVARMAITCGVGLNNAMASAVNMLGDVHGGAGEQLLELFFDIDQAGGPETTSARLDAWRSKNGKYVPGYGHRFHKNGDPRAPRLLALVQEARDSGDVDGRFMDIALAIGNELERGRERLVPMNIDGATAVIFAELGFPAPLARGLFCLSRSVGILAHAWEQKTQGGRNKGPMPTEFLWKYEGPASP